ncbi:hypothetical protein VHUM_02796 [Vanrija humicola]|uniref:Uncharacterized protein n=1 Tax=Vanrija humicola TaxID=5417 RepID=A0A7D8V0X7_VANHU|nr:hypothetical protein VHUM_02796 [Vanrija humicola]
MSRLAALSTPQRRARTSPSPSPSPAPASPTRAAETTHHRMLKLVLAEVNNVINTWDDIVAHDGLKAGKGCIDEVTEMDNILLLPEGPERPLVAPHLDALTAYRTALQGVLTKLEKLLSKLAALVEQSEKVFFEACKVQTWDFVLTDPLWLSWTLENFVDSLPPLVTAHSKHLGELTSLANVLLSSSTSFEDARTALERWRDLARGGERWEVVREWEELVQLETGRIGPEEEEEQARPKRRGKR